MNQSKGNYTAIQGITLILPITLTVMGVALLAPIVPKLMQEFADLPNAQVLVPLLLPLPALCIALFSPFAGWIGDRTSHRRLLIWACFIYSFFGVAPAFLTDYWPIFATRVGVGICEAVIITCSTSMIANHFGGELRDKWLGSQAALASLSSLGLFPLAGLLGSLYGWQGPFYIYATGFLMGLAVLFLTSENDPVADDGLTVRDEGVKEKLPIRHLLKVCSITIVGGVFFYIVIFQLSTALQNFQISSPTLSGLILSLCSIGVPIGAFTYQKLHKIISSERLVSIEYLIFGLGFIGMAFASNLPTFVVMTFISQFGLGLFLPTMLTWAVRPLTEGVRGKGTGIWQSTFCFGQFASTLCFAFVLGLLGQQLYMKSFAVFGVIAVLMALITFIALSPSKSPTKHADSSAADLD